jgi:hypothetical protein
MSVVMTKRRPHMRITTLVVLVPVQPSRLRLPHQRDRHDLLVSLTAGPGQPTTSLTTDAPAG